MKSDIILHTHLQNYYKDNRNQVQCLHYLSNSLNCPKDLLKIKNLRIKIWKHVSDLISIIYIIFYTIKRLRNYIRWKKLILLALTYFVQDPLNFQTYLCIYRKKETEFITLFVYS